MSSALFRRKDKGAAEPAPFNGLPRLVQVRRDLPRDSPGVRLHGRGRAQGMRSPAVISILAILQLSATLASPHTIREALLEISTGKLDPAPLSVKYDDCTDFGVALRLPSTVTGRWSRRQFGRRWVLRGLFHAGIC